jgi:hypothetical protein
MIPQDFIVEWKQTEPWPQNDQVVQNLIICATIMIPELKCHSPINRNY